jgi:hypothetical protein
MPSVSIHRLVLVAALGTVLVAACGGGAGGSASPGASGTGVNEPTSGAAEATTQPADGAATPGTVLSACEIVTADDIKAATRATTVEAGTLKATPTSLSPGRSQCTYEGDYGRIIVELTPEDGANLYDAARKAYKDAVDVTGLGDGAFTSESNNRAFVWQGAVAVMLTTFFNGDADMAAISKDLATKVVAKL